LADPDAPETMVQLMLFIALARKKEFIALQKENLVAFQDMLLNQI
jgi:hypothetical protein